MSFSVSMSQLAATPVQGRSFALAPVRCQGPLPASEPVTPLPPLPPDVLPPPLDTPPQVLPEIREPDQPGQHLPITDNPSPSTPTRH